MGNLTKGPPLDVEVIRKDFPILSEKMRGKRFVYLDNSATALKPRQVIDAVTHYYTKWGVNIHRGSYQFSEEASVAYDEVRDKAARFINAPDDSHVIFTSGTTDSTNLIAYAWARKVLKEGDEILVTETEHHANLIPWQETARAVGAALKFIPLAEDGSFILDDLDSLLTEKTRFVAVTGMSNVTGYISPVKKITGAAHAKGAVVLVDGAQLVSHTSVDVKDLDCDLLVFSSHKMCGPNGVGVLYGKGKILKEMDPFHYGGDMILKVWKDRSTYTDLPGRLESGTPNIEGVLGFGAAIDYLESIGMDRIHRWEQELLAYAMEKLKGFPDITLYGPRDLSIRGGIISFNIDGVHPHDVGAILDSRGVAVRTGFHCAQPMMRVLGAAGTVRASIYLYNTREDIDIFIDSLEGIKDIFA